MSNNILSNKKKIKEGEIIMYVTEKIKTEIEVDIDIEELYDKLGREEKEEFITERLDDIDEYVLCKYLRDNGYRVEEE